MGSISRRRFIQDSTAIAAGWSVSRGKIGRKAITSDDKPSVKRYKPFGRTGHQVSDISIGFGQRDSGLVRYAFDAGMTLIDTAYEYPGHEELIGQVLPKYRKKIFVVSKWDPPLVTDKVTKKELLDALDVTLKRLKTSYVDCMMIHAVGNPELGGLERIQNPAIYEAWEEAKRMGKVRFTGASSHGANMLRDIGWAVDNDRFDVILLAANFMTRGLEPLLKKARTKGIATMAMKTMSLYVSEPKIKALVDENTNARQACLKYVLAQDIFDTIIISIRTYDQVKEYLTVSGATSLTRADSRMLRKMAFAATKDYCRPGCDGCQGVCPNEVPIADILRYKMYFEDYGEEKRAMGYYHRLPGTRNAIACSSCDGPCEASCTYGIPIRNKLMAAHDMLTLV